MSEIEREMWAGSVMGPQNSTPRKNLAEPLKTHNKYGVPREITVIHFLLLTSRKDAGPGLPTTLPQRVPNAIPFHRMHGHHQ